MLLAACLFSTGCSTLRGRADDALKDGNYRTAVELYTQLLAENPKDARIKGLLTRAEQGMLDEALDTFESERRSARIEPALHAGLVSLQTKDKVHAEAVDDARKARLTAAADWSAETIKKQVCAEAAVGQALSASARKRAWVAWVARPEVGGLGADLDAEIAGAGTRTCKRAAEIAGEAAFAIELVAAYCKEIGGPLPPWKPRPLLVGGMAISGAVAGTPNEELGELQRVVHGAIERSVWFSQTSALRATADLQGSVSASFDAQPTELSRSWVESVPYEATETYRVPIEVPYQDNETYTERIPYTAYEERMEPCRPPAQGMCARSHPVTRYRNEVRTRPVTKFRTEWVERTRVVTKWRDEPRVFRYMAMKHDGRYQAQSTIRVTLGPNLRIVNARESKEEGHTAYEHDAEFAPAGVHPERAVLPTATAWRAAQRERIGRELLRALDASWVDSFCSESLGTLEQAARCAHARPAKPPNAVRSQVSALFNGDNPELVLALPRPREGAY